jgi:hypothetical protein
LRFAVCIGLPAQRQHAARVAWRGVCAGGSAMANKASRRLCRAAERGDVAGIAAALLAGADPNAFEDMDDAWTPLQWAAARGHVAAIAALLAAGARVDGTNSLGGTPLMNAALKGDIAAVAALLAAGAEVNHVDRLGHIALHRASMYGRVEAARVLLEAGARTDLRSKEGNQPIDLVCMPTCPLALPGRACVRLKHCPLDVHRCAWLPFTSPPRPPSACCSPPLPPGRAAGPWRSPATRWSGSGRRKGGGAAGSGCVM